MVGEISFLFQKRTNTNKDQLKKRHSLSQKERSKIKKSKYIPCQHLILLKASVGFLLIVCWTTKRIKAKKWLFVSSHLSFIRTCSPLVHLQWKITAGGLWGWIFSQRCPLVSCAVKLLLLSECHHYFLFLSLSDLEEKIGTTHGCWFNILFSLIQIRDMGKQLAWLCHRYKILIPIPPELTN